MKIEFKNVTKPFNHDFNILNDVSFELEAKRGEIVVFAGDEGCGKTTLLDILAGVETNYSGDVYIGDKNRREYKNEDNNISYVMFEPVLMGGKSVLKNLLYVFYIKDKKYDKLKALEEIKEVLKELGLIELLSKKAKKLTRFEKLLVCYARILLKKPSLILIDEPLFGLEGVEKNTIINSTKSLTKKLSSVVVITEKGENLALFEDCKVLRMDGGKVF